ncbi:MAG: rod shape-determining protein RodA, partial [Balneolaceae bacterium]
MIHKLEISWSVIFIWISLAIIGLVAIYSATQGPVSAFLPSHIQENFGRQVLWIAISVVILIAIQFTSPRTFQGAAYPFYIFCII